jgi:iron-sulfur cluster assembly accessory protein
MSLDTKNGTVTLTETAATAIQDLFTERQLEGYSLRVFVASGGCGCSGPQYGMALENNQNANDSVFTQHGVNLVIDDISAAYLAGAVIDYIEDEAGSGFKIENPNEVATSCGCGGSCA